MKRLTLVPTPVQIDFDGHSVAAREGEPVACALLAADETTFSRSSKYHRPRGPYCLEGACAQCLMRVDGVPNVATCQVPARAGMRVERQNAFPNAKFDLFSATDWFFPRGLNHHELFAGVPVAEQVMAKVARHLGGLGRLPDAPQPLPEGPELLSTEVAIVGAGPAGLAAAEVLALHGVPFALLEREPAVGGRLRAMPVEPGAPALAAPDADRLRTGTAVLACYEDQHGSFLAAVRARRLLKVRARVLLFANGGVPQLLPFVNNDLPGIYSGRAASALVRVHGLLPGPTVACVGDPGPAAALARLLESAGGKAVAVGADPVAAHGGDHVTALTVREGGREHKVGCDAVAVCAPPGPAFELARQAGAEVSFRHAQGLFAVDADADGRTARAQVFAAGDLLGPMATAAEAAESGRRAARAAAGLGR